MNIDKPICCDPQAFELMKTAARTLDTIGGLLLGAVAIARHEMSNASIDVVNDRVSELADQVRRRVRGQQSQALLAHLHDVLFVEEGFIGNTTNYHDPANSYLPAVLESKRGLPITLSLIYYAVGRMIGLDICGIGLPGHFCAGYVNDDKVTIVDTFYQGRLLNRDEAKERVRDTCGPQTEWSDELLDAVDHRHWLTRIMQNLLHTFGERDRLGDVGAMLELQMVLWPDQLHLQRDLALVLARAGRPEPAGRWLGTYLDANPEDPQREDLEQLLVVLAPRKIRKPETK